MTGPLVVNTTEEAIKLTKAASGNHAYMGFYDEDKTTRRGWVGVDPNDDVSLAADTGHVSVLANGSGRVVRLVGQGGTLVYNGLNVATGNLNVVGAAGINGSLTVAGGLNLTSGNFNVAGSAGIAGGLSVGAGLGVTGQIDVLSSSGYVIRARASNNQPTIDFLDTTYSTQYGYLSMAAGGATLAHNAGALNLNREGSSSSAAAPG